MEILKLIQAFSNMTQAIMFTDLLHDDTISHSEAGKKWVVVRGDGAAKQ